MVPEFLLIFGCFGLGLVLTYGWWLSVRVSLFRLDMLKLVEDVGLYSDSNPSAPVSTVTALLSAGAMFAGGAELLSFPILRKLSNQPNTPTPQQSSENGSEKNHSTANLTVEETLSELRRALTASDTPPHLREAIRRTYDRLIRYLFHETLSGWSTLLLLTVRLGFGEWKAVYDSFVRGLQEISKHNEAQLLRGIHSTR